MPFERDLKNAIHRKMQQQGQLVMSVVGPAGSGKSAFARECAQAFRNCGLYQQDPGLLDCKTLSPSPFQGVPFPMPAEIKEARDTAFIMDELADNNEGASLFREACKVARDNELDLIFVGEKERLRKFYDESDDIRQAMLCQPMLDMGELPFPRAGTALRQAIELHCREHWGGARTLEGFRQNQHDALITRMIRVEADTTLTGVPRLSLPKGFTGGSR